MTGTPSVGSSSCAAAELQVELGTPDQPKVDVAGSPFLTQIAAQSIDRIDIEARQVGTQIEGALALARVDMVLTDVSTDDWFVSMTAAHAEGNALIDWAAMQRWSAPRCATSATAGSRS